MRYFRKLTQSEPYNNAANCKRNGTYHSIYLINQEIAELFLASWVVRGFHQLISRFILETKQLYTRMILLVRYDTSYS